MKTGRLSNKHIFITAAGQGMGYESAKACLAEGAHVTATDINGQLLEQLKKDMPSVDTYVLDVTDFEQVKTIAGQIETPDVLFNCAGYVHHGTVLDCDEAGWDFSFDLNVKSMYRTIRVFLPKMLQKTADGSSASIINMSSMASSIKGFVNRFAYGTTKAAVIGMTKAIAIDYVKSGIRCNAICPGTVDTPSLRQRIAQAPDPVLAEKNFLARQPMGRFTLAEEVIPMVIYLASDESRIVTGQAFLVDGGVTI